MADSESNPNVPNTSGLSCMPPTTVQLNNSPISNAESNDATSNDGVKPYYGLNLSVDSAKLASGGSLGLFKPDPYVELSVDQGPTHRTECIRSTYSPKWDAHFPLLVTPYSRVHLRVLGKSSLTKDHLIGDCYVDLYELLRRNDGQLNSLHVPFLLNTPNHSSPSASPAAVANSDDTEINSTSGALLNSSIRATALDTSTSSGHSTHPSAASHLLLTLSALQVNMAHYPPRDRSCSIGTTSNIQRPTKSTATSIPRLFKINRQSTNQSIVVSDSSDIAVAASFVSTIASNSPGSAAHLVPSSSPPAATSSTSSAFPAFAPDSNPSSTTAHSEVDQNGTLNELCNEFQSTLPRWSLNDPNSNPSYPRPPPPHSQTSNALPAASISQITVPGNVPSSSLASSSSQSAHHAAPSPLSSILTAPSAPIPIQPSTSVIACAETPVGPPVGSPANPLPASSNAEQNEELPQGKPNQSHFKKLFSFVLTFRFFVIRQDGKFVMTILEESISWITTRDRPHGNFRFKTKLFHHVGKCVETLEVVCITSITTLERLHGNDRQPRQCATINTGNDNKDK
jgi:hypothetical protein